jgi:hypothetical protein
VTRVVLAREGERREARPVERDYQDRPHYSCPFCGHLFGPRFTGDGCPCGAEVVEVVE